MTNGRLASDSRRRAHDARGRSDDERLERHRDVYQSSSRARCRFGTPPSVRVTGRPRRRCFGELQAGAERLRDGGDLNTPHALRLVRREPEGAQDAEQVAHGGERERISATRQHAHALRPANAQRNDGRVRQ